MTFSIVVPVCNAASSLRTCLASVFAAAEALHARCKGEKTARAEVEVICVDDGSTDGSAAILDECASNPPTFQPSNLLTLHVIHQPNAGPGAARNAALDVAKAERIIFVDADDTLAPDALVRLSEIDADIVTFLPPGGTWDLSRPSDRSLLFSPLVGNLLVWNAAYRREMIGDGRFPALRNHEDLVWTTGMFARARTVVSGVKPWYVHREDVAGSLANSYSWRRVRDGLAATWLMFRAARGAHAGIATRLVLVRKLTMPLLLHVLAAVPWARSEG